MTAVAVIPNEALRQGVMSLVNRVDGNDPSNAVVVVVLCSAGDSVANLRDFDNLQALLAGAATESAFTNYARVVLDQDDIVAAAANDSTDEATWELADLLPLIASAGGATDEGVKMILLCFDPDSTGGDDSSIIVFHITTDDGGADLQETNGSDMDLTSPNPTLKVEQA